MVIVISQDNPTLDKFIKEVTKGCSPKNKIYGRQLRKFVEKFRSTVDEFHYPPKFFILHPDDEFFCIVTAGIMRNDDGSFFGSIRVTGFRKDRDGYYVSYAEDCVSAKLGTYDKEKDTGKEKDLLTAKIDAAIKRAAKTASSGHPKDVIKFVIKLSTDEFMSKF